MPDRYAQQRGADYGQGYPGDFRPGEGRRDENWRQAQDARSDAYRGHIEYSRGRGVWRGNRESPERYRRDEGSFAGRGPRAYRRPDDSIEDDVCNWLGANPDLDASDIEVQVQDGEVKLTGSVTTRDDKHLAEDIVASVSGVRDIDNRVRVTHGRR